jgi:hypothetical protein
MASSKEDIASQALARLGEPSISSFEEDSETAEKVSQLYESTIQNLLGRYQWNFASRRAVLSIDGGKVPANEWKNGFILPAPRTEIVGNPYRVYNSTGLRAPEVFDYEIEGRYVLTNFETIVVEYTARVPESQWTGYFQVLAIEALAATLALPVTENASKEQWHQQKAFGSPSENGEGGLFKTATAADDMGSPPRSLLDETDPMYEARFSGSRNNGWW